MSFWDNVKKFAQPYADDDYDDYEEDDYLDDYEEPAEPARRPRRTPAAAPVTESAPADDFGFSSMSAAPVAAPVAAPAKAAPVKAAPVSTPSTGFSGSVLSMSHASKQEVVLFRPTSFNDTSKAADDLRNRKAVIVNMENVDKAMARRVVDFLSGCVYALDGTVNKIAQSAYLFCPANMDVIGDLENLQVEVESYI